VRRPQEGREAPFPPGLLSVELPADREAAGWRAFAPILAEIAKLRDLDLTDVHPAIVFSPSVGAPDPEPRR
jgi:hypothetical protein